MPNFCEACGSQLTGIEAFCWKCGVPVRQGAAQPAAAPQSPVGGFEPVQVPPPAPVTPTQPAAGGFQPIQPQPAAGYQPVPVAQYEPPPPPPQPQAEQRVNVEFQEVSAPANPAYAQVPAAAPPAAPVPVVKSNTWITILVAVIAVLFLGVLVVIGGILYVAHRVSQEGA